MYHKLRIVSLIPLISLTTHFIQKYTDIFPNFASFHSCYNLRVLTLVPSNFPDKPIHLRTDLLNACTFNFPDKILYLDTEPLNPCTFNYPDKPLYLHTDPLNPCTFNQGHTYLLLAKLFIYSIRLKYYR